MREIKTEWRIKKTDLLAMGLFLLVFFLAVLGLDKCLGFSQRISAEKFPWIAAGFVAVSWIVADLYMSFDWAVGFGRTRRQYLLETVWVYVAGTFLLLLESRFLNEIFPIIAGKYDRIELGIVSGSMVLLKIAAWAVFFTGIGGICALVLHRFGIKGATALMMLVFLCLGIWNSDLWQTLKIENLTGRLQNASELLQSMLTLLVGVMCCGIWIWRFRKAPVN